MDPTPPQYVRDDRGDLSARCGGIDWLVMDVDGVLTDGSIVVDDLGRESKSFNVRDGSGLAIWRRSGRGAAILSGRRAACVDRRAAELGVAPVIQGARHKGDSIRGLLDQLGLVPGRVAFVGDDLPDLPALRLPGLGLAACPADAAPEVAAACHYVAKAGGGRGVIREVVELILKSRGEWEGLSGSYR